MQIQSEIGYENFEIQMNLSYLQHQINLGIVSNQMNHQQIKIYVNQIILEIQLQWIITVGKDGSKCLIFLRGGFSEQEEPVDSDDDLQDSDEFKLLKIIQQAYLNKMPLTRSLQGKYILHLDFSMYPIDLLNQYKQKLCHFMTNNQPLHLNNQLQQKKNTELQQLEDFIDQIELVDDNLDDENI